VVDFWLGTHRPNWLERTGVPLFISRRTLCQYRTPPRASGSWALDSGGFSELSLYGRWTVSAKWYAEEVTRWSAEVGQLRWASVMDWMCEEYVCASTALAEGLVQPDGGKLACLVLAAQKAHGEDWLTPARRRRAVAGSGKALRAVAGSEATEQRELFDGVPSTPPTCSECGSIEISGPSHSNPYDTCADCGHSWGPLWDALKELPQ
jgi:hypothetical protein